MSWFINTVGSPAAVKAVIAKDPSLSASLKEALTEICNDQPWSGSTTNAVRIVGNGHSGPGSSIDNLKVERLTLAPEPPAPPA